MRIRRIEVHDFRSLTGTTRVDGLGDGLTVVAGENEEGKSTLLAAIRAVLFERHRVGGRVAEQLLPFGTQVRPEVRLDFTIEGQDYSIFKAFCQRPAAELVGPTGRWTGEEAERELGRLLRTRVPGRGASKLEHRGIWGMLWVEQGRGYEPLELSGPARTALQSTLQREVGNILGGETGRRLLEVVSERRSSLLDKRGNPRGEYKTCRERLEDLRRQKVEVDGELETYRTQVEQLAEAIHKREAMLAEGTLRELEARHSQVEQAHEQVVALEAAAEEARRKLEVKDAHLQRIELLHRQREELAQRLGESNASTEIQSKQTREVRRSLSALECECDRLASAHEAELDAERATDERLGEALARKDAGEIADRLRRAKRRLRTSRKHAKAMAAIRTRIQANPVDETVMAELRRARTLEQTTAARLEAAAASVIVRADGHTVRVGDRELAQGQTVFLIEPTVLTIDGVGTVEVFPGGEELECRAIECDQASLALERRLEHIGFGSFEEAAAAFETRRAFETELWELERRLHFEAPEGANALEEQVATLQVALTRALEVLEIQEAPRVDECELRVRQLTAARERRRSEVDAAHGRLQSITQRVESERRTLAGLEARTETLEEQVKQLRAQLAAEREARSDDHLADALIEATTERQLCAQALRAAQHSLERVDPEARKSALAAARSALKVARQELQDLDRTVRELRIHLTAGGRAGLGERRSQLENELAHEESNLQRFERVAGASGLLLRVLQEAAEDAKRRFVEPVRRRVGPYLALLFPNAELQIDAELRVHGLRRNDRNEPFESLSVGTREQLTVLTRLAFADILYDDGQPVPVLLDDVLVYSDDQRFARMKSILKAASERQQVLVFTCREREWSNPDVNVVRLSDCRLTEKASALKAATATVAEQPEQVVQDAAAHVSGVERSLVK